MAASWGAGTNHKMLGDSTMEAAVSKMALPENMGCSEGPPTPMKGRKVRTDS